LLKTKYFSTTNINAHHESGTHVHTYIYIVCARMIVALAIKFV